MSQNSKSEVPASNLDCRFELMINDAIRESDHVLSNFKITRCHYLLGKALQQALGEDCGANFHSWAVWGSRKAGVTIRQEDKDQAGRDATLVAGIVGVIVGIVTGFVWSRFFSHSPSLSISVWAILGCVTGAYCGYLLAIYTRREAALLILEGNRIVLDDIGRVTAKYLAHVASQPHQTKLDFLDQLRPGRTEDQGQQLLVNAFQHYDLARHCEDPQLRHQACYFANCLAILHEHIRLQPLISASLPFLIKKCVTQRLMTYSVGEEQLSVHEDVPPLENAVFPTTLEHLELPPLIEFLDGPKGWGVGRDDLKNTGACDWTQLKQRMAYVVNLFRSRHLSPEVTAAPYTEQQFTDIAEGRSPARPW